VYLGESLRGGGASESLLLLLSLTIGQSCRPKPLAPWARGFDHFFLCGLVQPALRVLLPLLPAAERGGGRRARGGGMAAGSGLVGGLLRLLPEVGGEFRRCRGGGAPPSLSSEDESENDCRGGGPPSESEGHPLAQRQQRRRRCV
jgi:hypothetical protein